MAKPLPRRHDAAPAKIRCAIYTRKSTEEGLEQDFNSLDAQREACAAYILSQRHEGWQPLPDIYDDGGFSGGTMERPALKALLAQVAAGKVDVIVVYKVDRLTRALSDFAKIVEILDAQGASFVSVTQAFNTTTSMGRLTLNVLLSFAQFEREVTGERIRDKIAASKKKGMWMGGPVPLGYDVVERKLIVNDVEAATVRRIFTRYLELGSGRALQAELDRDGVRSKSRVDRGGRPYGVQPISRGPLYVILQNRIYTGAIVHQGTAYPGQHDAIIDQSLFDRVQAQIEMSRVARRHGTNATEPSLLAGLMRDGLGRMLSPTHATKGGRRYRYYVSQTDDAAPAPAWRIGALEIERIVCGALGGAIRTETERRIASGDLESGAIVDLTNKADEMSVVLSKADTSRQRALLLNLIRHIDVEAESLTIHASRGVLEPLVNDELIIVPLPRHLVRTTKRERMLIPGSGVQAADPATAKLIARAFAARAVMLEAPSIDHAATALGYSADYVATLARISYLAPDIITAMLDGCINSTTPTGPLIRAKLPIAWSEQRVMLLA